MKALQVLKGIAKKKIINTKEFTQKAIQLISASKPIKHPYLTQKAIDEGKQETQRDITARFKAIGV